jgi:hypothetical protein
VETGVRRDGWVEISAGLEEGQQVVVTGLQGLRDGDAVHIAAAGDPQRGPDSRARGQSRTAPGHVLWIVLTSWATSYALWRPRPARGR